MKQFTIKDIDNLGTCYSAPDALEIIEITHTITRTKEIE